MLAIIFLAGLIPVLYLTGYVHASGDDYHYGAAAHRAFRQTHSFFRTLGASWENTIGFWHSWQGTWFTIFLMGLQPEVFSPNAYWIVPLLMLAITIASTSVLTHYLLVRKIGFTVYSWLTVNMALLFAMLQFIPRTKSAIFWWNGAVHYIVPYALAVMAVYCFMNYIDTYKLRHWLGALFCMFGLGGSSYLSALMAPVILVYLLAVRGRKNKRAFLLLIPLGAETVGLAVSMLSPGNTIRGGEGFGFGFGRILKTIGLSFWQAILTVGEYIVEKPFVFLILFFMAVVVWEAFRISGSRIGFRYPAVFVLLMFCAWSAMFAPGIYAAVEVSGGVPNTIFQFFLLTVTADIVYCLGWLANKRRNRIFYLKTFRGMSWSGIALCAVLLLIFYRGTLRQTTFYNCASYIMSGRADDYKEQMDERMTILLDDSRKVIELPEMNPDQGPLMHMEIMENPDAWTNTVMCEFYDKKKVVQVKR